MDESYAQLLYGVFGLYILLLCVAAVYDTWKFIIPNAVTVALTVLFIATALLLPFDVDWLSHVAAAGAVLLGGALLFKFGRLGGGDVKLLTAVALWAGLERLPDLLLYVTLAGGALALVLMVVRRLILGLRLVQSTLGRMTLPRFLLVGESVPYAAAIAPSSIYIGTKLPHLGGDLLIPPSIVYTILGLVLGIAALAPLLLAAVRGPDPATPPEKARSANPGPPGSR